MSASTELDVQEFLKFCTGLNLILTVLFVGVGGMFLYTDITGRPQWMVQYKVQVDKNQPVDIKRLKAIVPTLIGNFIIAGVFMQPLIYMAMKWRGCDLSLRMPSISNFLTCAMICASVNEIGFYYSHRALHHPWFYKWIHKKHHEWNAPISIVAVYAHPIEFVVSSILPLALGPILCKANLITAWSYFGAGFFVTLCHHSGYHVPYLPSPTFHDFHHTKFNQNYGVLRVMDWLHGTDKLYRKHMQSK